MDLLADGANHAHRSGFGPDHKLHRIAHHERVGNVGRGRDRLAQSAIGRVAGHANYFQPLIAAFGCDYP